MKSGKIISAGGSRAPGGAGGGPGGRVLWGGPFSEAGHPRGWELHGSGLQSCLHQGHTPAEQKRNLEELISRLCEASPRLIILAFLPLHRKKAETLSQNTAHGVSKVPSYRNLLHEFFYFCRAWRIIAGQGATTPRDRAWWKENSKRVRSHTP